MIKRENILGVESGKQGSLSDHVKRGYFRKNCIS